MSKEKKKIKTMHDKKIPIQNDELMNQACSAVSAMKKNDTLRVYDMIALKIGYNKWFND